MKKLCTLIMSGGFLLAALPIAQAQTTYTLGHSQPPELLASTSADVTLCTGNSTVLSGTPSGGTPTYTYAWTPSTGLSTTTNDTTTASPTSTQTYTFTVTDDRNCTASHAVAVTIIGCAGLEDIKEVESFNLYPNPTDGEFSVAVQFKSKPSNVVLQIFNMNGELLLTKNYQKPGTEIKENFDLTSMAAGNYLVRISVGKNALTQTFIIK